MNKEIQDLIVEIRKYDPSYVPKSVGKYLLVELQSKHLDHQIKYKKRPKYKHRFANSLERHW
ncbi:hypothetical protein ORO31_001100 [Listeria monocytogenes]|uniref:Transposase n=1 Tax=Listeria immobilis TaxID=2713502 RepID=A0A7X0X598_9LIST|nr:MULTISPECIES: hypothetical protein [Listeria]EJP4628213.1 hypothetical protein [Listeria monocytogenes]AIS61869.1 hypothetical protein JL53_03630 [Listeria ivanovii subsp. londoniensis]EJQ2027303.1 hypothetical protein [Listeria monocytogenes]EJZ7262649.1 hypothetical protein [Listeria monocytogenes]EKA2123950.1 hypothetical protein [Listeria monocytogenes]